LRLLWLPGYGAQARVTFILKKMMYYYETPTRDCGERDVPCGMICGIVDAAIVGMARPQRIKVYKKEP
jgi:hypothetical protein